MDFSNTYVTQNLIELKLNDLKIYRDVLCANICCFVFTVQ